MVKNILFSTFFIFSLSLFSGEGRLFRFPAIHGNKVVFSYAGDLYTISEDGGIARKITSHIGYEMFPRFSPDGSMLAFTGQYDGNTEVFVVSSDGGVPRRVTYTAHLGRDDVSDRMGPNNIVMTWSPDGKSIIYRSRQYSVNSFVGQLYSVPVEGGLSSQLPLSEGGFCSYSPDGRKLAFNRVFREFRTWKYYQGGMADDIWIFDSENKSVTNVTNNKHQDIIPMWYKNNIYFLSDRERIMNIFEYNTVTKTTRKVTNYTDYDVKFPSLGDGKIVFEQAGWLHVLNLESMQVKKIPVEIADDLPFSRTEVKNLSQYITDFDLSPDGEKVLFSARGEVLSVPVKTGITLNYTATSGVHERSASWSPDGKFIAYISDKSGEVELYMKAANGLGDEVQLTDNADTYRYYIEWSPDSKKIAFCDRKLRLQYIDIDTKEITLVDQSDRDLMPYYEWSPDSKWITYVKRSGNHFGVIYLYNLQTKIATPVTHDWFDCSVPVFSHDGKYLFYSANKTFNPIFSDLEWNYSYINLNKIYFVTLSAQDESPFLEKVPGVSEEKKDKEKDKESNETADIRVDLENISDREIELPVKASNYYFIRIINDKVYYLSRSSVSSQINFKMYDLKDKKEITLGDDIIFNINASNNKMIIKQAGQFAVIDLPTSAVSVTKAIDLSSMKTTVNYREEWQQIFDESWRQMRDFFYVENMNGVDWKAMHEKYQVLVPYVNHRNDLSYIIGEMIGELNAGHAYINTGEKPEPAFTATGLLGAKLQKHASGYFQIVSIFQGANWSDKLYSPLKEVGLNIQEGDYILEVNAVPLKNVSDIYTLLTGTVGKYVELTVNSKPEIQGSRKVFVKPIDDESELAYFNWVQENIKKVEKASNGQVGYVHIPDMMRTGLNEFARYYYPQLNKKGLIIDDRGNGGGNVSSMIIERLRREVSCANMKRNVPVTFTKPVDVFRGSMVMLVNKYSASDGDLFPYQFKKFGLGELIGTRTWGGVVGIYGSLPFIDGTDLRKPESGHFSIDKKEWIIEGVGVEPDIVIDNDPYQEFLGNDAQLDKAIEVIMKKLEHYEDLPPIPEAPDKSGN